MATVRGGAVRPHVQAFADACKDATGADNYGTYNGHDPSIDRALDIFVPVSSDTLGNAICDFAIANLDRFGVDYIIYRQRIYNPDIKVAWRPMAERGPAERWNTVNHFDHVHISFEPTGADTGSAPPAPPAPEPQPQPSEEDEGMKFVAVDSDRGIFLVGSKIEDDGKINARHMGTPEEIVSFVESGTVADYDKRPVMKAAVFDQYFRVVG